MKVTGIIATKHSVKHFFSLRNAVASISSLISVVVLLTVLKADAQNRISYKSDDLYSAILKANTLGSVLYVAAHPDDENTRLLSYLARERNYRTGYLSITRGDGGQNLIGKEQGDQLGLIRTQELLAARKVDGAEQYFTRACDFGYSKNPEETFSIWNKDSILSDVVWVIRKFRPDIIICRFPTTGEGGHGHHTASAMLAEEAFSAAADPEKFLWQLAYVEPWQTKRLFWNTFNFGSTNTTSPDQLKIEVGVFNPLLGRSHGEIAAESRSNHKSQGFGSAAIRGSSIEYFKQLKGDSVKSDVFEGINTEWSRLPRTEDIRKSLQGIIRDFNHSHTDNSIQDLVRLRNKLHALDSTDSEVNYWKKIKSKEIDRIILGCAGLWCEALVTDPVLSPGTVCRMKIQAVRRSVTAVKVSSLQFPDKDSTLEFPLAFNELTTWNHEFTLAATSLYSSPYWLQKEHTQGLFTVENLLQIGDAENASPLTVKAQLEIAGSSIEMDLPVTYKSVDPIRGEVYRPIELLPPITITFEEQTASFFNNMRRSLVATLKSNVDSLSGTLSATTMQDWKATLTDTVIQFTKKGEEIRLKITVQPGVVNRDTLRLNFTTASGTWNKGIKRIKYDHIPEQFYLLNSAVRMQHIQIEKSDLKIGYIEGAGDAVANCLSQTGYDVSIISEEELQKGDLHGYSAIVTGVRAFNTEQQLIRHRNTLVDYVKAGGNLIVQYNTNNRLGPAPEKIGPYPFTISNQRVTDEHAEVRFLAPDHPALKRPNNITSSDFENWIQERGIYFATAVDSNYIQPLGINDPNEKENSGSLIITQYGKGNFVYTGLAFFRELPAGVPGAYRLFVNLIELPKHP
ncbi:MAG: PIG-L family deacetylase [Bacteroidota bacterium]